MPVRWPSAPICRGSGDEVRRLALLVANQRDRQQHPYRCCGRGDVALFHLVAIDVSREKTPELVQVGIELIGVGDVLEGACQELGLGVSREPGQRLVDLSPPTVELHDRLADRGMGKNVLETLRRVRRDCSSARFWVTSSMRPSRPRSRRAVPDRCQPLSVDAALVVDVGDRGLTAQRSPVEGLDHRCRLGGEDFTKGFPSHSPGRPYGSIPPAERYRRSVSKVKTKPYGKDRISG